ncbi:MAG: heparinase II/III domain-containing protein [Thermomicrobiales bacterium]
MDGPRLFTSADEMAVIRRRLHEHDWYATCFANLRTPVDELLRRGIRIPREKGFVFYETCPTDNARLRQDPFNPADHICPTCGVNYTDEANYRAWVTFYQLYVAQRALDMGIVYQVTRDDAYATAIRYVLTDYARHYEEYPLVDCVLGPTRLFQSTYIESLWLAALAGAADMVRETIPAAEWRLIRDGLFLPAAAVIMDYDEGRDNRQAMNNAAIGLVGMLCEDDRLLHYALHGPHGWFHHLEHSVLADGLWYEGNNYHFATLPAMANLAEAVSRNGEDLYRVEVGGRRFQMMFDAPLTPLYPDLAFPARKDSQFGISLATTWHVGMYELGYRRYGDPVYARLLRELYARAHAESQPLRWASGLIDVADPCPADRERLDWRGFLHAAPVLDAEPGMPVTTSVNMAGTGLGILRQDEGRTYAAIDYGHYGGGHGHPDRLQLLFYARGKRWLVDWGTGAYFFDHLRWYRSSIAHNTVVVNGQTQRAVDGTCRLFAVTPSVQAIRGEVDGVYPGVRFRRTAVLLSPDLLLDLFVVEADRERQLDWALHSFGDVSLTGTDTAPAPAEMHGEHYEWLHDVRLASSSGDWSALFRHEGDALAVHVLGAPSTSIYTASAFGPPPQIPTRSPVVIARRTAARTTFAALFEHRAGERAVTRAFRATDDGAYEVTLHDGSQYLCRRDDETAAVSVAHIGPDSALVEENVFAVDDAPAGVAAGDGVSNVAREISPRIAIAGREESMTDAAQICRGERHWRGVDDLSARFRVDREGETLRLQVAVTDDVLACSGPVEQHFDYDSVQVYFDPHPDRDGADSSLAGVYGLVLAPASPDGEPARVFPIGPVASTLVSPEMTLPSLDGVVLRSSRRPDGYDLDHVLPLARIGCDPGPGDALGFDLILNDNDGTFRRAQQMIWTGAEDSRIWLKQDYHPPQRFGLLVF